MKIKIGKKFIITNDSHNYILNKITYNKKTKEETLLVLGYYNNMNCLFEELLHFHLRTLPISTLEGIKKSIDNFKEMIREQFSLEDLNVKGKKK